MTTSYNPETKIWCGPTDDFTTYPSVGEVLLSYLQEHSDKVFQIFHDTGHKMTFRQIYQQSIKLAKQFQELGLQKGDFVSIIANTHPYTISIIVALYAVGAVVNPFMPTDVANKYNEKSLLKLLHPRFVIFENKFVEYVKEHAGNIDPEIILISYKSDAQFPSIEQMFEAKEDEYNFVPAKIASGDQTVSTVIVSSGTTGTPKPISLSHSMLLSVVHFGKFNFTDDVIFVYIPMDWITGFLMVLKSIFLSNTIVITTLPFTPQLIIDMAIQYNMTNLFMSPTMATFVIQQLNEQQKILTNVRGLSIGGEPISKELLTSLRICMPIAVVHVLYGLTEIPRVASLQQFGNIGNSVGFLIAGIKAKIVNKNNQQIGPTEVGELCLKFTYDFLGYYNSPQATAKVLDKDGFLYTGDIGYFDNKGYLYIYGRKNDVFHSSNYLINLHEIENILNSHEGVKEACVVRIEHPILHYVTGALVVKNDAFNISVDDLHDWISDKLPENKYLKGGIFFVDDIPKTRSNKKMRLVASEIALKLYNQK